MSLSQVCGPPDRQPWHSVVRAGIGPYFVTGSYVIAAQAQALTWLTSWFSSRIVVVFTSTEVVWRMGQPVGAGSGLRGLP